MIINFKLDDYDTVCDEYEEIFSQEDIVDVVNGDDCLVVRTRRIVIPALHTSFREAEWATKDSDFGGDDWEIQASVFVQYEENETDPTKYISYATCGLMYFAEELRRSMEIDPCDVAQLDCYIDTSEFIR